MVLPKGASPVQETFIAMTNLMSPKFTRLQGQYLAYFFYHTKINGRPPAERDMQMYFKTSPASVQQMVLRLEAQGLTERTPGQAREELPDLD